MNPQGKEILLPIAKAPPRLLALCTASARPREVSPLTPPGPFMTEGRRNTDLMSIAGALRRKGLNEEQIFVALMGANDLAADPLPEQEVKGIARSAVRYEPDLLSRLTERTFSETFVEKNRHRLRYCAGAGWYFYDGRKWRPDTDRLQAIAAGKELTVQIEAMAEALAATLDPEDAEKIRRIARACQKRAFINAGIELASASAELQVEMAHFDASPNLLNLRNGTLDLDTSTFRPHNSADLLTKIADVDFDPAADCPIFDRLLSDVLEKDTGEFLLRAFAYGMLGLGREQKLVILVGRGRNGKTTVTGALENVVGDYLVAIEPRSLSTKVDDNARNDLARLAGTRIVVTTELPNGMVLDSALVKKLTGGDTITARFLFKEYFQFKLRALPILVTNFVPVIEGSDGALVRRLLMIRFDHVVPIEEVDPDLPQKLEAEKSGILNRLLAALRDYRKIGLAPPVKVLDETARYAKDSNLFERFLEERCDLGTGNEVEAESLYNAYHGWCISEGVRAVSQPTFKRTLEDTFDLHRVRKTRGYLWQGIKIRRLI